MHPEYLANRVVHAAYTVHSNLGPGLLKSVYEVCFCHELAKAGIPNKRQVELPVIYDGLRLEAALRLDVLVDETLVCELKAVETMHPVYEAQLLTYLKLTDKRLGFLLNFNTPLMKNGIKRMIR